MLKLKPRAIGSTVGLATNAEAVELDDAAVARLLGAEDARSIATLAAWLKANSRAFTPVVIEAIEGGSGLSADAARAVLDAFVWRVPNDAETTLTLMEACLTAIAARITDSLNESTADSISNGDDSMVCSAVALLTANRRSRHSETAIRCLADAGPGGTLVLARAFDAVRSSLRLYLVQRLKPAEVLMLGDNVVASLARSVSRLAEELESPKNKIATRFLEELGPVRHMEPSEIGESDPLEIGAGVFHASWGAGTVVAASDESATIDFGSAGTRTLLRSLMTLRHAV